VFQLSLLSGRRSFFLATPRGIFVFPLSLERLYAETPAIFCFCDHFLVTYTLKSLFFFAFQASGERKWPESNAAFPTTTFLFTEGSYKTFLHRPHPLFELSFVLGARGFSGSTPFPPITFDSLSSPFPGPPFSSFPIPRGGSFFPSSILLEGIFFPLPRSCKTKFSLPGRFLYLKAYYRQAPFFFVSEKSTSSLPFLPLPTEVVMEWHSSLCVEIPLGRSIAVDKIPRPPFRRSTRAR